MIKYFNFFRFSCVIALCALVATLHAQISVPLQDMSFWQSSNAKNWQIVGSVTSDLTKEHVMKIGKGTGVLANLPDTKNRSNLVSVSEYGDVEVSFDFMMSKYSNSGFYLQGRYEVQLLDSWGRKDPAFNDCGGIFARRRFEPKEELFEGHAPIQNACLAPGLWQTMEIAFRAPRFDAAGKKIANAKMLKVRLNGVTVQENVELTGPTGGPISEKEASNGPFMIQGDHGEVAFRNILVNPLGSTPVKAGPMSYEVIYGAYRNADEFEGKPADLKGTATALSWELTKRENNFVLKSKINLEVIKPGKHEFTLQAGGNSILKVNGVPLMPQKWVHSTTARTATIDLPAGNIPVELIYFKMDDWMPPMLRLSLKSADGSSGDYQTFSSTLALTPPDPIYLDAKESTVFRSFVDYYEDGSFKKRMVHPANVGHPDRIHYTYDMDNGAVAQVWKGQFLNVSPMWDNRGDGSSQARGMVVALGDKATLVTMAQMMDTSSIMGTNTGFRTLGYDLEEGNQPDFRYTLMGATIKDRLRITDGKYLTRTLEISEGSPKEALFCRLAFADKIEEVEKGLYAINDFSYFIRIPKEATATVLRKDGKAVLYTGLTGSVQYEIIF
jgi:hypothetical protein